MQPPLALPLLPTWAQQLGGILPLTALIDFTDVETKLHLYELSACVPLWNWPVTPAGGRLLLSKEDTTEACCLDRPGRSAMLECFDGRHGDRYPSSAAATTALWASTQEADVKIANTSPNLQDDSARKQTLEVFLVSLNQPPEPVRSENKATRLAFIFQPIIDFKRLLNRKRLFYRAVDVGGWICWLGILGVALPAQMHLATAYLLGMPLTGLAIGVTHGRKHRKLVPRMVTPGDRIVVATNSRNGSTWWAFYGQNYPLNSLLNVPLYRRDAPCHPTIFRWILGLLILGQWGSALASCSLQSWDALLIFIWIAFCACITNFVYRSDMSVKDWLRHDCHIHVKRIHAEFASRRAMLSAIVYLNPDTKDRRTAWMDPILSNSSPDRKNWELALLNNIEADGECADESVKDNYWWKFIEEGVEMGRKIKQELEEKEEC